MAYDPLLAWVMTALRKGWTPERIEGRLAVEFPDDPRMRVSHECLYQWIYAKPQRILDLRQYLPRGKRRRTRAKGRRSKGPRIPMRVPIAQRPKRVFLVKSVFRVSSLIFFGFRHEECRPVVCFTGCPSCRT